MFSDTSLLSSVYEAERRAYLYLLTYTVNSKTRSAAARAIISCSESYLRGSSAGSAVTCAASKIIYFDFPYVTMSSRVRD